MGSHAPFSPSGFEAVMLCPGKLQAEAGFEDEPKEYSAEGTFAHTIREECLKTGVDADSFIGRTETVEGFTFTWDRAMASAIQPGIDRIRDSGGTWFFEQRVSMENWIKDMWGTLDAGGILPDLIVIDDLKFGRGTQVDAFRCVQLMLYAVGFWYQIARHHTKTKKFLLRIDQPRVPGGGSEWHTTLEELLEFMNEAIEAAIRALDPNAPRHASPKACAFCLAARHGDCYELDRYVLELLGLDFDDLDYSTGALKLANPQKLDPDRRQRLLENARLIKNYMDTVYRTAIQDAVNGDPCPGYKAVETLGDRQWEDEEEAEQFLLKKIPKKDVYKTTLISPAQAENILGTRNWAQAEKMITRNPGKPALVPLSDPRPALIPVINLFDDLDATAEEFDDLDDSDINDLI